LFLAFVAADNIGFGARQGFAAKLADSTPNFKLESEIILRLDQIIKHTTTATTSADPVAASTAAAPSAVSAEKGETIRQLKAQLVLLKQKDEDNLAKLDQLQRQVLAASAAPQTGLGAAGAFEERPNVLETNAVMADEDELYTLFAPKHSIVWSRGWYMIGKPPTVPISYYNSKGLNPSAVFPLSKIFSTPCASSAPIWVRTRDISWWASNILPSIKDCKVILVSSDGDTDVPTKIPGAESILASNAVECWYSQNVVVDHPKLKAIPLGLAIHDGFIGSPNSLHTMQAMAEIREEAASVVARKLVVLHDKGQSDYGRRKFYRERAHNKLKGCPHVEPMMGGRKSPTAFWKELTKYSFATAVTGMGWDTHRLWELIYLGTIPIVERTHLSDSLAGTHLPLVVVDSFDEVCSWDAAYLESLRQEYAEWIQRGHEWMEPGLWVPRQKSAMDAMCKSIPGCA
jgi:hypothetical protein